MLLINYLCYCSAFIWYSYIKLGLKTKVGRSIDHKTMLYKMFNELALIKKCLNR